LVLTPRRLLGYGIRDRLDDVDIPVHSFYHEEALEGKAAQQAFALLSLLVNVEDRVALRWWLGDGSPSARRTAYQRLRQHCEQTGDSPRAALEELDQGTLILPRAEDLLEQYRNFRGLLANLRDRPLGELVDALLPAGSDECSVLREVALLALPDIEDIGGLFDRIKTHVTQPEMPE
jgi:hypothetical protein